MNIDKWDWIVYLTLAAILAFNDASWWECIVVPLLGTFAFHFLREQLR